MRCSSSIFSSERNYHNYHNYPRNIFLTFYLTQIPQTPRIFSVYFPIISVSSVIVKTCVFLSILFGRINFYVYFCTE